MFKDSEIESISGHLVIVAMHYDDNAADLRKAKAAPDPQRDGPNAGAAYESLAQQFERQAKEARAFAERIENRESGS
jgi:hypothetical protein